MYMIFSESVSHYHKPIINTYMIISKFCDKLLKLRHTKPLIKQIKY